MILGVVFAPFVVLLEDVVDVVGNVLLCPDVDGEEVVDAVVLTDLVFDLVLFGGTQICLIGSHTSPGQQGFLLHFW